MYIRRLRSGVSFLFQSSRFTLEVAVDAPLVDGIMDSEASTKTLNLFALYVRDIFTFSLINSNGSITDQMYYGL